MIPNKGDPIEITCGDRVVDGVMGIISENCISAIIYFDAMLDGHVGAMPLMAETSTDAARGIYRSLITGTEVMIRKKQNA